MSAQHTYRFAETSCSQCGQSFGPGDHGFSHCNSHRKTILNCYHCGGEGKLYTSRYGGNDPDVWPTGTCPVCDGKGQLTIRGTVRTSHVYPPIPDRSHDWTAWVDGQDEETRIQGWGATEEAAIKDLFLLLEDET